MEETLRFVHECGARWAVKVHWVEWRDAKPCFEEVGYNSASREGEPFAALIAKKKMPPNWQARFCTQFLKVKAMAAFLETQGFVSKKYSEVIGLGYLRCLRGTIRIDANALRRYPRLAPPNQQ
jgi:3'-phosphoadenosine 5'-phosphosulfate sulfotransferase (PAPS reductase)/FAD synthetase